MVREGQVRGRSPNWQFLGRSGCPGQLMPPGGKCLRFVLVDINTERSVHS